jgi:hypothetical protein
MSPKQHYPTNSHANIGQGKSSKNILMPKDEVEPLLLLGIISIVKLACLPTIPKEFELVSKLDKISIGKFDLVFLLGLTIPT